MAVSPVTVMVPMASVPVGMAVLMGMSAAYPRSGRRVALVIVCVLLAVHLRIPFV